MLGLLIVGTLIPEREHGCRAGKYERRARKDKRGKPDTDHC